MAGATVPQYEDPGALREKLREILESWPLYRQFRYTEASGVDWKTLPPRLLLHCEVCKQVTIWETYISTQYPENHKKGHAEREYTCRNCGHRSAKYYYLWTQHAGVSTFSKTGQYPPLEERISPALLKAFDTDDVDLYKNALRCRNFNLGIGALSYLRRVVG